MSYTDFYESLSSQRYWHKLADLFQLVQPQKPEKGCKALILKARQASIENQSSLEMELAIVFQGAEERTHRRVGLFGHCKPFKKP
jgi:hypothetical protein